MLRRFLPLGAIALGACHLVAGLDGFSSEEAGAAGGGGGGGTSTSSGGVVLWASALETSASAPPASVALTVNQLLIGSVVEPPVTLLDKQRAPDVDGSAPFVFGGLLHEGAQSQPVFDPDFWLPSGVEVAVAEGGQTVSWLASVVADDLVHAHTLRIHSQSNGKWTSTEAVAARAGMVEGTDGFSHPLVAVSPDTKSLYVAANFTGKLDTDNRDGGDKGDVVVVKFDVAQPDMPVKKWLVESSPNTAGSGDRLVGLVATNDAVILAVNNESTAGFSVGMKLIGKGSALVKLKGTDGSPATESGLVVQCSDGAAASGGVFGNALARNATGEMVVFAVATTCDVSIPTGGATPEVLDSTVATHAILGIDSATLSQSKSWKYTAMRINGQGAGVSALETMADGLVLIGGTFMGKVYEVYGGTKAEPPLLVSPDATVARGFLVSLAANFQTFGSQGISVLGSGTSHIRSLSERAGKLAIGGEFRDTVLLGTHTLEHPGGYAPFVAYLNLLPLLK